MFIFKKVLIIHLHITFIHLILIINNENKDGYFLEWNKMMLLLKECGFKLHVIAVTEGNLQEIVGTFDPNVFETTQYLFIIILLKVLY